MDIDMSNYGTSILSFRYHQMIRKSIKTNKILLSDSVQVMRYEYRNHILNL